MGWEDLRFQTNILSCCFFIEAAERENKEHPHQYFFRFKRKKSSSFDNFPHRSAAVYWLVLTNHFRIHFSIYQFHKPLVQNHINTNLKWKSNELCYEYECFMVKFWCLIFFWRHLCTVLNVYFLWVSSLARSELPHKRPCSEWRPVKDGCPADERGMWSVCHKKKKTAREMSRRKQTGRQNKALSEKKDWVWMMPQNDCTTQRLWGKITTSNPPYTLVGISEFSTLPLLSNWDEMTGKCSSG